MCHLSMKLSDKFDPNPKYSSDKIVVKHISVKETIFKLDLEPKGQGHSKQQNNKQENKNTGTDESNRLSMTYLREQQKVNKGQELSS